MGYKVTASVPKVKKENLRNEAARRVYEELLRYKQTIGKNA